MDITLKRILSLIPQKEDGTFVHGAQKKFAESIGLKSGNLISDWINGRSKSYDSYIYEIADKYNVSAEWLQGYTDVKEKPTAGAEGMSPIAREIINCLDGADEETLKRVLEVVRLFVENTK